MLRSENYVPVSRRNVAYGVIIVLFALLIGKFYYLQIYQHEKYRERADYNRIRLVTTNAPRGLILAKNGKILAANRSEYTISVIPVELVQVDGVLGRLSSYLDLSRSDIEKNMIKYGRGRFLPARICRGIPIDKLSYIEEHKNELPGVMYSEFPVRLYPDPSSPNLTHILGYLREIDKETLKKMDGGEYQLGDFIGAQGIEKQYELTLKGKKGHLYYQVDAMGCEVGLVQDRPPVLAEPGENITLTIDADLQAYAETLLNRQIGAVVMLNSITGEILTMVSKPDYRLDNFAGFIDTHQWQQYLTDPARPLLNRATMGLYPPGSAMKIITTIAALENGLVNSNWAIECMGEYFYGDRIFGCWKPEGHGIVNMDKAITESCNIYFYQLVQRMGLNQWYKIASQFGFGQLTGVDLPEEYSGLAPDKEFMNKKYGKRGWTKGYLLNIAIGQGDVLVTPLQMATFAARLATKGKVVMPRLVSEPLISESNRMEQKVKLSRSTWSTIYKLMYKVVNDPNGTAYSSRVFNRSVKFYGKTGTAENPQGKPHAWFVGFANKGNQSVSIAVLIENGGHGGESAAPIASKMIQYFYGINSEILTLQ
ncbi:MAG: penicillin-binding protein 2 [Candidatus Marinimicrobia bacterium]|nr:penicillin-binding protein 2 [Candidatus Neomarinimicrobiota bacterium]